jgi:hypothetical protein
MLGVWGVWGVITPLVFRNLLKSVSCGSSGATELCNGVSGFLILVPENPWTVGSNLKIEVLGRLMVGLDYDPTAKWTGG